MDLGKNWIYYIIPNNKSFNFTPMENVDYFSNALVGLVHLGWFNARTVEPNLVMIARYEGSDYNPDLHSSLIWDEENCLWKKLKDGYEIEIMKVIPHYQEDV